MREFVGSLLEHADRDIENRDNAIRWAMAYAISTMELLRGIRSLPSNHFKGILSKAEFDDLGKADHPPLFAVDQARHYLTKVFSVDSETTVGAYMRTQRLIFLEDLLHVMLDSCGGLERIASSPLTMAYMSHLRTFLMLILFLLPYIWGPAWGWSTIPIVALMAFAWLGVEAASIEAEHPFLQNRVNSLDMDSYCIHMITIVKQQLKMHADWHMKEHDASEV